MEFDFNRPSGQKDHMKTIEIPVTFTGTVAVRVPDHLSDADAKLLAGKLAVARIVATCENPDAPEDAACDEYQSECSKGARKRAEKDWDASTTEGVSGTWAQPDNSTKSVITIHYGRHGEPTVTLPPDISAEIKLVDGDEEGTLVLNHNNVSVYQTIKDDMGDAYNMSEYWYSTQPLQSSDGGNAFDVRDLPAVPVRKANKYEKLFPDNDEKQRLAYVIDTGELTDDGLSLNRPKRQKGKSK